MRYPQQGKNGRCKNTARFTEQADKAICKDQLPDLSAKGNIALNNSLIQI
jgi:hypothetical protein